MIKNILSVFVLCALVGCTSDNSNQARSGQTQGIIDGTLLADEPIVHHVVGLLNMENSALCTGTLIKKNIILTAAHCVPKDKSLLFLIFDIDFSEALLEVMVLGEVEEFKDSDWLKKASDIIVHESYKEDGDTESELNDFALVSFSTPAPTEYRPVEMLTDKSSLKTGDSVVAIGYGTTHAEALEISVKEFNELTQEQEKLNSDIESGVLDPDELSEKQVDVLSWTAMCEEESGVAEAPVACMKYKHEGEGSLRLGSMIYSSEFNASEILLASGSTGGPCSGDSGGPALIEKNNKYYILGVASRADISCKSEVIYGDVTSASVKAWIKKNSALLQSNSAH